MNKPKNKSSKFLSNADALDKVKIICKTYDISPAKSKGQNFLINQEIVDKIIFAANIEENDTIVEVGPGLGILTEGLLKKAKKVISIELDKKLFSFLQAKFIGISNLQLICDDILTTNSISYQLKAESYKIISNLPYNITSHFLKKFLTAENRPQEMTLLVQKEVAERICAKPGQMSLLTVSVNLYGRPEIISLVDKNNFWPVPQVDSAILKISEIKNKEAVDNYLGAISEKEFWRILKIGFSARRKQLHNNLSAGLKIPSEEIKNLLKEAKFDQKVRAQDLSIKDWISVINQLLFYMGKISK